MTKTLIGSKNSFAIDYSFDKATHATEIAMFVKDKNLLEFKRGDETFTTRWNLDEIVFWLRGFLSKTQEDPFPVDVAGQYAAEKDVLAREYDNDDIDAFDAYYDTLDAWNLRHRWHTAANGAILADIYFQFVGPDVEISWNNRDQSDFVEFSYEYGGDTISKKEFCKVVEHFLQDYADYWYPLPEKLPTKH